MKNIYSREELELIRDSLRQTVIAQLREQVWKKQLEKTIRALRAVDDHMDKIDEALGREDVYDMIYDD